VLLLLLLLLLYGVHRALAALLLCGIASLLHAAAAVGTWPNSANICGLLLSGPGARVTPL
jgi:hypothetical protein